MWQVLDGMTLKLFERTVLLYYIVGFVNGTILVLLITFLTVLFSKASGIPIYVETYLLFH